MESRMRDVRFEREAFFIRKLVDMKLATTYYFFRGDTDFEKRRERIRAVINHHQLAKQIVGTRLGMQVTFGEAFQAAFDMPLFRNP